MHWYGGSIAEAVNLSKQKNAIFVVFVEGDNDLSEEMAATIDDTAVLTRLSDQGNFLAVKLKSGSANYIHFAQIYQFVPVPSLFFIGRNGTPLEVVCAGVQPSNLATRIDRILEEHFKDKQPSASSSTSAQASTSSSTIQQPATQPTTSTTGFQQNIQQTISFVQTEAAALLQESAKEEAKPEAKLEAKPEEKEHNSESGSPPAKISKNSSKDTTVAKALTPDDMICDGDVCVRRSSTVDEPGPSQAPTPSLGPTPSAPEVTVENPQESLLQPTESEGSVEEKMERAKELIEALRREKADKEKELEKEKEIERRQAGKGVAELKRWQADQELKQIQEERRREKMENNLARQRILEQIAQDRAERRARDQPQSNQPQQSVQPTHSDGGGRARIQFKLPDGTSHTAHFDSNGTLREVQRYVADNLRLSSTAFSLWTAFPRQELTDVDASLRGLQLAPSAALLVLPRRTAAVVARPSAVSSLISRTFGRPMKKMMQALIPLVFQIGAASTWAVVAALVGVKTLVVTLVILKLLLVAGAAKVGALFASKTHGSSHGWEAPHQKEIHLHIHNGGHPEVHEEHGTISGWSRDGTPAASPTDNKNINLVINPYAAVAGPQTISTPYGNYVRVDSPNALSSLSSLST